MGALFWANENAGFRLAKLPNKQSVAHKHSESIGWQPNGTIHAQPGLRFCTSVHSSPDPAVSTETIFAIAIVNPSQNFSSKTASRDLPERLRAVRAMSTAERPASASWSGWEPCSINLSGKVMGTTRHLPSSWPVWARYVKTARECHSAQVQTTVN